MVQDEEWVECWTALKGNKSLREIIQRNESLVKEMFPVSSKTQIKLKELKPSFFADSKFCIFFW
jgi:hypothetical protein